MIEVPQDMHILQHSLGVDCHGRGQQFRNHFVTGPGGQDYDVCIALVWAGLMRHRHGNPLTGWDDLFTVTDAGKAYVTHSSPQPPKLTRSQRRYQRYLDYDGSLSFREWLSTERVRDPKALPRAPDFDIPEEEIPF